MDEGRPALPPVQRVEAQEVVMRLRAGEPLLLVCAYASPVAWSKLGLVGAIPLPELREHLDEAAAGCEVVLYCRCPRDGTAVRAASSLGAQGIGRVRVLAGGYEAALAAGLRPLRRGAGRGTGA